MDISREQKEGLMRKVVSYRNAFACKNTPSVSTYDGYHPDHDVAVHADPGHGDQEGKNKPERKSRL